MSDPATPALLRAWRQIRLVPIFFFAGLAGGLGALAWLGAHVGAMGYHTDFVRFNPPSSPEGNYYPSVDEMCSIVRHKCRPDQVLVIVGGNSILLGVWQPVTDLWSTHLQEQLGDRYCVVNLAFRGSSPPDCGGVVAEMLRNEYPRQIYIADEAPITNEQAYGSEVYRFAFWQAYFSGRLLKFPIRDQRVREYLRGANRTTSEEIELRFKEYTDRFLHYHDLWNWVGFEYLFTIPAPYSMAPPRLYWPRKDFLDQEPDATDPAWIAQRYPAAGTAVERSILIAGTKIAYTASPDGHWTLLPAYHNDLLRGFSEAFPDPLKARTLILIPRSSPHYTRLLDGPEKVRTDQAFADTVALWKEAGYDAMQFGAGYTEDDYGDRSHLSKLGGRKLAQEVAGEVAALAARLHYTK